MSGGVLVPAFLAVAIVTGRALMHDHRAPYPYELASTAIVFAACGIVGEFQPTVGAAAGWAYVVALILRPSSAELLNTVSAGLKAAP